MAFKALSDLAPESLSSVNFWYSWLLFTPHWAICGSVAMPFNKLFLLPRSLPDLPPRPHLQPPLLDEGFLILRLSSYDTPSLLPSLHTHHLQRVGSLGFSLSPYTDHIGLFNRQLQGLFSFLHGECLRAGICTLSLACLAWGCTKVDSREGLLSEEKN